jgi:hypothetical protein
MRSGGFRDGLERARKLGLPESHVCTVKAG